MMLCKSGKESDVEKYHLNGWVAEKKIDGVRCLAFCDEQVKLIGRSGSDYTSKFPEVVEDLKGFVGVFDGEISCDTFNHTASRVHTENKLKSKLLSKAYPSVFYVFDVIQLNGDLRDKPLNQRVRILTETGIGEKKSIELVERSIDLVLMWEKAKKENWEGLVLKKLDSKYSDKRSCNWIKVKKQISKDIVVDSYSINSAGIRCEGEGFAVQITGSNSQLVKNKIDETGSCLIEVKGLEETENGKIRQIVFKEMK